MKKFNLITSVFICLFSCAATAQEFVFADEQIALNDRYSVYFPRTGINKLSPEFTVLNSVTKNDSLLKLRENLPEYSINNMRADFKMIWEDNDVEDLNEISNLNKDYIESVGADLTTSKVKYFQNLASSYDITKSEKYTGDSFPFQVVFFAEKGFIEATYNKNGELIMTKENFTNVSLPSDLAHKIATDYPGWSMVKNRYKVFYKKGNPTEKYYTIGLTDGENFENLVIDPRGNML